MDEIKETVRSFVLREFLEGEAPANLGDTTPLITSGVLDSLATLKLVAFLEERYGVEFAAHEVGEENLNTIVAIAEFVRGKQGQR